ncbi:MAG TPA: hypothetical protein VHF92_05230 [Geodermatophilus sp.]|nr:hypothetical protein [Geodermatophilus sp.]
MTTPAELGAKVRREVARLDARGAARRLGEAIKERGVHLRAEAVDGMATVTAVLTMPEAQALYRALAAYADALADDPADVRTRGQKMADCLLDLVLRPGESDLPPVQVLLTVVAGLATLAGGDPPGEIDGHVVPADMVRQLVQAFSAAPQAETQHEAVPAPEEQPATAGVPWQQAEQDELERWWAETERRVLAGEPGLGPDPLPETLPDAWTAHPDRLIEPLEQLADPYDQLIAPPSPAADPPDAPPDPLDSLTDAVHPPDPTPPAGTGWWAAADRAVDAAGLAVRRAEEAMAHARRAVRTAIAADAADEAAWQDGPGGRISAAEDALAVLRSCTGEQREQLAGLLSTTGGGGLAERPRIPLTDALSGTLLALTDLAELRRAGTCGHPDCRREPGSCTHDLSWRPGLGPPARPAPTARLRSLTAGCGPAIGAAGSPAVAAGFPVVGSSTTTGPTRSGRAACPTSPATAPPTTAASTRHPGGGTISRRTAR